MSQREVAGTTVDPMLDLDQYKALIDECASNRINQVIPNGTLSHALVLISKLFDTAKEDAAILSAVLTDVNDEGELVYADPDVIEHAKGFLRRAKSKLVILLEGSPHNGEKNRFLEEVIGDPLRKGDLTLYLNSGMVSKGLAPHFMVTDGLAYRRQISSNSGKATANFGDEHAGQLMRSLFQRAEQLAKQTSVSCLSFGPGVRFQLS